MTEFVRVKVNEAEEVAHATRRTAAPADGVPVASCCNESVGEGAYV